MLLTLKKRQRLKGLATKRRLHHESHLIHETEERNIDRLKSCIDHVSPGDDPDNIVNIVTGKVARNKLMLGSHRCNHLKKVGPRYPMIHCQGLC